MLTQFSSALSRRLAARWAWAKPSRCGAKPAAQCARRRCLPGFIWRPPLLHMPPAGRPVYRCSVVATQLYVASAPRQVIALACHLVCQAQAAGSRQPRPFLIAVPASVLPNWEAELGRWAPSLKESGVHVPGSCLRWRFWLPAWHDCSTCLIHPSSLFPCRLPCFVVHNGYALPSSHAPCAVGLLPWRCRGSRGGVDAPAAQRAWRRRGRRHPRGAHDIRVPHEQERQVSAGK